jgi:hypothetical protein
MSEVVRIAREHTYVQGEIKDRSGVEWSSKVMSPYIPPDSVHHFGKLRDQKYVTCL